MIKAIRALSQEEWKNLWDIILEKNISNYFPYIDSTGYYTEIINKWNRVTVISCRKFYENIYSGLLFNEVAVTLESQLNNGSEILILNKDQFSEYSYIISFVNRTNNTRSFDSIQDLTKYLENKEVHEISSTILASYEGIKTLDFFDNYNLLLGNCGVITANSVEELSWVILKGIFSSLVVCDRELTNNENHIVLPYSKKQFNNPVKDTVIYNNESTLLESFERLVNKKRINSFYISTHGSEDCILLSDSIVCGQSKRFRGNGMDCKINEKCPIHKKGILAADIPADFVVNSTCFGYRPFNTILPSSVSLSNAFLENHASIYISSIGIKHGPDAEICLLHNLLLEGYTAGESVQILNNWLYQSNVDFPCYLVIGNPNQKYRVSNQKNLEETLELTKENDIYRMTIKQLKDKSFLKIKLDSCIEKFSYIENTSRINYYYSIVEEKGERYLYLYSWQNFNRERIEIIFHSTIPKLSFNNFQLSELEKKIVGNKYENETTELTNLISESASTIKEMKFDPNAFNKIRNLYKNINEKHQKLQEIIIEKLMKKSSSAYSIFLPELYIQQVQMLNHTVTEGVCFICDNKAKEYTFKNEATSEKRFLTYCPKCGCISDYSSMKKVKLEIIGRSDIPNLGIFKQTLVIKNISSENVKGLAFLTHLGLDEWSSVNKNIIEFELEPGKTEEHVFEFEIMKEIQPSIYYFKSMAITNSELYYANKPIFFYKEAFL
ncbi:hypothetical protein [Mangrovibacillus cuniculi]|uniref:Uncharacterized protein n=1 Tax=Mangrovibacillus cuniculi TaxID=2593652 RepID=A0A7S8CDZ7_9BACI|nr:hypothetical protein [Mangrovibacillus cuniculi]QPC48225.1 hypothetical protein G8O30_15520 [Mangrovibacillus cuniculi]